MLVKEQYTMLCAHKNKHTQVCEEKRVSRYCTVFTKALNVVSVLVHFEAVVVRNSQGVFMLFL